MDLFDKINSMEKMAIVNKNNKIFIYFPEYFNCNVLCKNNDIYSIETAWYYLEVFESYWIKYIVTYNLAIELYVG